MAAGTSTASPGPPPAEPSPGSRPRLLPAPRRPRRWGGLLGAGVTLLVLIGGALSYPRWREGSVPAVRVVAAREGPVELPWSATGYVEGRVAELSAPEVGRVVRVAVQEGEAVVPGQPLVLLEEEAARQGVAAQQAAVAAEEQGVAAARAERLEATRQQGERERRAEAAVAGAAARVRQAEAVLERERRVAAARVAAAAARTRDAAHRLADLEQGPRPQELAAAEASVAEAEAAGRRAAAERARAAALYRERALSRQALEEAAEGHERAVARVARARSELALLQQGARPEQVAAARAALEATRREQQAEEELRDGLAALERDVEERRAALRAAEAARAEARAAALRLPGLRAREEAARWRSRQAAAALQQVRAGLAERLLRAPFAGRVGRRLVEPGDLAVPGKALLTVVEAAGARVEAEVESQDLAAVAVGQRARVTSASYPGREFVGVVRRIGAAALPQVEQTRTSARVVRVGVELTGEARRRLLPGMEVDVSGARVVSRGAVLVPHAAVHVAAGGTFVQVVEDGRVVHRPVRPGFLGQTETELLHGLRPGESVILYPDEPLAPGTPVRLAPAAP